MDGTVMLIRIGEQTIDGRRYVKTARADDETGPRLEIYLDNPRNIVTVAGHDAVDAALAEIRFAMSERDRAALGTGWTGDDDGW